MIHLPCIKNTVKYTVIYNPVLKKTNTKISINKSKRPRVRNSLNLTQVSQPITHNNNKPLSYNNNDVDYNRSKNLNKNNNINRNLPRINNNHNHYTNTTTNSILKSILKNPMTNMFNNPMKMHSPKSTSDTSILSHKSNYNMSLLKRTDLGNTVFILIHISASRTDNSGSCMKLSAKCKESLKKQLQTESPTHLSLPVLISNDSMNINVSGNN